MMKKILIYTEGGLYLGLGNVYRMLELARSLKQHNQTLDFEFITSSEPYILDIIKERGFSVTSTEEDKLVQAISHLDFNILIIDKLNIDKGFLSSLKEEKVGSFKTVLFGNVSDANHIADLVVNAIIGTDFSNRKYLDEYHTLYLTGPKYLTLRDEFKNDAYVYANELKNIVLLFGGTDQSNFSCKVLQDFNKSSFNYNISIVIGKGYQNSGVLEHLCENTNAILYKDINNVNEIMTANDFLITSPGTALFEGLYMGMPCLALYQNESQQMIFRDFFMTKDYYELDDIESTVKGIYDNIDVYQKQLATLEIGQGKNEIIIEIIKLID